MSDDDKTLASAEALVRRTFVSMHPSRHQSGYTDAIFECDEGDIPADGQLTTPLEIYDPLYKVIPFKSGNTPRNIGNGRYRLTISGPDSSAMRDRIKEIIGNGNLDIDEDGNAIRRHSQSFER